MIQTQRTDLWLGLTGVGLLLGLMMVWPEFFQTFLTSQDFIPHGHCYLWRPGLVGLHLGSDSLIGLSYISISSTLAYLVYRGRQELPYHWMFLAFGLFIIACGGTHLMEVWTLWHPIYWLSGGLKLFTAVVSLTVAVALPPLIPQILALVNASQVAEERRLQLEQTNQELSAQIAERHQAEVALRQSESTLRNYFELPLIGIGISSPDKGWLEANDKLCEIFGYSRSELMRLSWADMTYPEDLAIDLAHFNRVLAGEIEGYSLDKRFVRPDGSIFYASISTRCIRKEDGSVDYFVALIQDISDRKQAEAERDQRIREQTARLAAEAAQRQSSFLSEASAALTSSLDYETTLATVVQLSVPALADWCFVDLIEADGSLRRLAVAHADPTQAELAQSMQRRFTPAPQVPGVASVIQGGRAELITEIRKIVGSQSSPPSEHWQMLQQMGATSYIGVPLGARGRVFGAISFVLSDSGRRFTEKDLHFAEEIGRRAAIAIENARLYHEAQEASRLKDEFLAIVSHELRTPLNAILGWAQILNTRKLDPATTTRALETIQRNARQQAQLIEDILDISRVMRGKVRLHLAPVKLTPVLEAALEGIRPAAQVKDIQLITQLEPEMGWVAADTTRIQQVLSNLLANAVKFTPEGGTITLSLRTHFPDAATAIAPSGNPTLTPHPWVQIQVKDTGIGIPPDFLPYVFDHFRQADSSTTRPHGGLGLGLAIARQLVELHQGHIRVESEGEGQGATFTVQLPLLLAQKPSESAVMPLNPTPIYSDQEVTLTSPDLTGMTVLAVDDEADTRDLLSALLHEQGATVITVASAAEALTILHAQAIDLLISDIGMPEEDGYSLIRQVRTLPQPQQRQVPALALTAYTREEDQHKAKEAGFQLFLSKPIETEAFNHAIARLLAPVK